MNKIKNALLLIFTVIVVSGCGRINSTPKSKIVGSWVYLTAESLGDFSQNDSTSIKEFDTTMTGKILMFSEDSSFKATRKVNGREFLLEQGRYLIMPDLKSISLDKSEPVRISLNDSILKIYSPNNASFVWKKQ